MQKVTAFVVLVVGLGAALLLATLNLTVLGLRVYDGTTTGVPYRFSCGTALSPYTEIPGCSAQVDHRRLLVAGIAVVAILIAGVLNLWPAQDEPEPAAPR